ncbi:hypothetical protein [Phormidium tenue]|jgi:hypothetical protein|uniref:Uncharacterized protein n=1 Tax=Phormidium tenue FACHB-1050 TaxID=2692857 RepID=A0ABR8CGZ6_9CYAN|nr:hypothetical protein [Phormidium tenue]MBD2320003.1 hypothetical protein [Phormidium tenue FACHB-1050]
MDTKNISYIKNVSNDKGWAYAEHPVSSYFLLHFHRREDSPTVEHHALSLPKGSVIILSQNPPFGTVRYLTHVVELVNDGIEDQPQWKNGEDFGILRWVKVLWAANFSDTSNIPVDSEVLKANWGWFDTKAKSLNSPNLMTQWGDINSLRTHLGSIFG